MNLGSSTAFAVALLPFAAMCVFAAAYIRRPSATWRFAAAIGCTLLSTGVLVVILFSAAGSSRGWHIYTTLAVEVATLLLMWWTIRTRNGYLAREHAPHAFLDQIAADDAAQRRS